MAKLLATTVALAGAVLCSTPRAARAEDGYGLTTAAVDAAPTALAIVGIAAPAEDVLIPAIALYALTGPVVHLAHDNPGRAGLSLLTRLGAPILVGAIALKSTDPGTSGFDDLGAGILGVAIGAAGAMVFDWLVLSAATDDADPAARARPVMFTVGGSFGAR